MTYWPWDGDSLPGEGAPCVRRHVAGGSLPVPPTLPGQRSCGAEPPGTSIPACSTPARLLPWEKVTSSRHPARVQRRPFRSIFGGSLPGQLKAKTQRRPKQPLSLRAVHRVTHQEVRFVSLSRLPIISFIGGPENIISRRCKF